MGGADWEASIRNRFALLEACLKLGFDAVPAVSDYTLASKSYRPKVLSGGAFIDEWGRIMEYREETKTTWWVRGTVQTEEDMENYTAPDPEEEGRFELVERVVKSLKDKDAVIMGQAHSGWHMAFQARGGIDKLLIDMYRRPELAHRFMEKVAKSCLGMAKQLIEGGVEVVFVTDDYADCRSPFMSMGQFREFELPNIRRLVNYARAKGIPVLKHSDGNIYPILDDMIEAGISGIHPIDVRRDVRRCIDAAGKGGGYVLASSNSIHANCKVENVYTMVDEARKYGKYPL